MNRLLLAVMLYSACKLELPIRPDGGGIGGGFGGIGGGNGAGGGGGSGGGVVSSMPPVINTAVFAAVGGATRLLADVANARIEIDPTQRDALTALGECADLLSYCYAPGTVGISE